MRVGFDDPFRPLAWTEAGRATGPLLEIAQRIVEGAGLACTLSPLPLDRSLAALAAGEVDALAFKAITPERAQEVVYTRPILTTGASLFHLKEESTSDALATPRNGPLVGLLQKRFPGVGLVLTEDYPGALDAVLKGNAKAAALNVHVGWYWAEALYRGRFAYPPQLLARLELAMALSKTLADPMRLSIQESAAKITGLGVHSGVLRQWNISSF